MNHYSFQKGSLYKFCQPHRNSYPVFKPNASLSELDEYLDHFGQFTEIKIPFNFILIDHKTVVDHLTGGGYLQCQIYIPENNLYCSIFRAADSIGKWFELII